MLEIDYQEQEKRGEDEAGPDEIRGGGSAEQPEHRESDH